MREKIRLRDTGTDLMVKMAEGNPGGLDVLMQVMKKDQMEGMRCLLDLDDMNIRGTQIWIGYKDYCGSDLDKFIKATQIRDQDMVDKINEEGRLGNHTEVAVTGGASFKRGEEIK